jgi:hypothetical protein
LRCSSSPFGSGLALRNRLNASWTSAGVQGLCFRGFGFADFFAGRGGALAAFLAGFFGTDGTPGFLALSERVILAMIGIY